MTAHDWLATLVFGSVAVACVALDVVRRRMDRRHANRVNTAAHKRLLREIRRQPR